MNEKTFKIGEVVRCKGGGPDMTVTEVNSGGDTGKMVVVWFTDRLNRECFPAESLQTAEMRSEELETKVDVRVAKVIDKMTDWFQRNHIYFNAQQGAELRKILKEAARSGGTPCVDQQMLREWGNKVFAIRAGVGPLA